MAKMQNRGFLAGMRESEAGNIFPLTAAAIFVLAGIVGGGVDMSRAFLVKNRLQNACDAGTLAGRRAVDTNGFDSTAEAAADSYFNVNFSDEPGTSGTSFTPTSNDNGSTVTATAATTIDTAVMNLFGFETIPLAVSCSATMSVGNSDVMMVLDTTGSMQWELDGGVSRISALRSAMKSFYDTVADATAGSNARVRYGFVPYSSTVNVGDLLYAEDPSWIADVTEIQSVKATYIDVERDTDEVESYKPPVEDTDTSIGNTSETAWSDYSGSYTSNDRCENNLPSNSSWSNNGASTTTTNTYTDSDDNRITQTVVTQPQSRTVYDCYRQSRKNYWVRSQTEYRDYYTTTTSTEAPIYKKETVQVFDDYSYEMVPHDTSTYKTGAATTTLTGGANTDADDEGGDDGTDQISYWAGCIEERATVATDSISYSSVFGMSPSGMLDLDIDTAPTTDVDTQWKPMWPEMAYIRTTSSSNNNVTNNLKSDYGLNVGSGCTREAQLYSEMTEAAFDNYADSLNPTGATYHSIGMIWGARLSSPTGLFSANVNAVPANGGDVSRHLIFMTDGEMDTSWSRQSAWGIEWHDRRITDDGYSDRNERHDLRLLAICSAVKAKGIRLWVIAMATELTSQLEECASSDSSFTATNSDQLNEAFQEIAKNVGELRVTQ